MKKQNYRNPYQCYNVFLQHHLQHLIIGFEISIKSSLPHWTLVKQLPCERNFRKWSIIFEDKCTFFLFSQFFVRWFWYGFSWLWLWHFKQKSKRKKKFAQNFGLNLAPNRRKSFCNWYQKERLNNFNFLFATRVSINLFFEIINRPFRTKSV